MELSSSNMKKNLIFPEMEPCTSQPPPPPPKFFIFQEMELSGSNIKKILIFSQKEAFLIFLEIKKFRIFQK